MRWRQRGSGNLREQEKWDERTSIRRRERGGLAAASQVRWIALAQEPGSTIAADARLQGRTYTFEETGVEVPYALFVPSSYDASREASRTSTCGRSLILD